MTAFATILALIPLAAGFNEGSIIAAELGTVVIGGLFSSTLLTLIVVPVLYYMVEGTKERCRASNAARAKAGRAGSGGSASRRLVVSRHQFWPAGRRRELPARLFLFPAA